MNPTNHESPSALLAKVELGVGNRDGAAYAVKTTDGKCFLVLDADTYHNAEVFCGMGSTEQVEISKAAFAALANATAQTKSVLEVDMPRLVSALEEIRKTAMDHPCFDADCFDRRDINGLLKQGGDICDWTIVAIHADDALLSNTN